MASIDLDSLERRARLRYELGRAARSVLGFAPALLIVVAAVSFGRRPESAVAFGGVLFLLGSFLLWRGQTLHKAVLPGLLAGLIPLTCALIANRGHMCIGGHCSTYCLPACISGGVVAGLVISYVAHRRGMGWQFWAGASGISILTGAMGCSCIGYSGVFGLAAGYLVGAMPIGLRSVFRRK